MPWLLWQVTRTGSRELFTLAVITTAISIAYGAAQLFNVSLALGAFFAGMVMRESEFSLRAAKESLPLRDAFAVLRSEEHTSELQSLMRSSYAVFCLKKKKKQQKNTLQKYKPVVKRKRIILLCKMN